MKYSTSRVSIGQALVLAESMGYEADRHCAYLRRGCFVGNGYPGGIGVDERIPVEESFSEVEFTYCSDHGVVVVYNSLVDLEKCVRMLTSVDTLVGF